MKRRIETGLIAALCILLCACARTGTSTGTVLSGTVMDATPKVAFVTSDKIGGNLHLGRAVEGLTRAQEDFGLTGKVVETTDAASLKVQIDALIAEGYGLIITNGTKAVEVVEEAAQTYTDTEFMVVGAAADTAYARSVVFRDEEGAFLLGMMAAHLSANEAVGAIYPSENAIALRHMWGFKKGAQFVKKDIDVQFAYTSSYSDTGKAKECVYDLLSRQCDFIYGMCGAANQGVLEAAGERGIYVSTTEEGDLAAHENMVTAYVKRMDLPVYEAIHLYAQGRFTNEALTVGLKEGAIGVVYITEESTRPVPEYIFAEALNEAKEQARRIIDGELILMYESDAVLHNE